MGPNAVKRLEYAHIGISVFIENGKSEFLLGILYEQHKGVIFTAPQYFIHAAELFVIRIFIGYGQPFNKYRALRRSTCRARPHIYRVPMIVPPILRINQVRAFVEANDPTYAVHSVFTYFSRNHIYVVTRQADRDT